MVISLFAVPSVLPVRWSNDILAYWFPWRVIRSSGTRWIETADMVDTRKIYRRTYDAGAAAGKVG